MITPLNSATQPLPDLGGSAGRLMSSAVKPETVPTDTVQISAQAAALQEVYETPAQTMREAFAGELQAKRLLAEQAAKKAA